LPAILADPQGGDCGVTTTVGKCKGMRRNGIVFGALLIAHNDPLRLFALPHFDALRSVGRMPVPSERRGTTAGQTYGKQR
jgi:hypothetical protein